MPEDFEEMVAHHAAMTRFAVHDLAPHVLERFGEDGLAGRLRSSDLADAAAVLDATRDADTQLRTRIRLLDRELFPKGRPLRHRAQLPPQWGDLHAAARCMVTVQHFHHDWVDALGVPPDRRYVNDRRHDLHAAHARLQNICRDVAHLCTGGVAHRARLLAVPVRWSDLDAAFDTVDASTAERVCRLAEAGAVTHTPFAVVLVAASRIDDETCDQACLVLQHTRTCTAFMLDAAQRLPVWQFSAAQRLFSAALEYALDNVQQYLSKEALLREALAAGATLDANGGDLASRLVRRGMPIADAATVARAAMAAAS